MLALLSGALLRPSGPDVRAAAAGASDACRTAAAAYPATVGRAARLDGIEVPGAAAWGDPAIIARCGVAALAPTADECVEVDGVGWVVQSLSDGTRLTTFGTDPALEILVPHDYDPAPMTLPAFEPAAKALPTNGRHCR